MLVLWPEVNNTAVLYRLGWNAQSTLKHYLKKIKQMLSDVIILFVQLRVKYKH